MVALVRKVRDRSRFSYRWKIGSENHLTVLLSSLLATKTNEPDGRLSFAKLADCLPQAIQIHGTQCTVVQTIAWLAGFTPDHPTMVRPHVTVETDIAIGLDDRCHIERAVTGTVRGFVEAT